MASAEQMREMIVTAGRASADIEGILERASDEWLLRYPDIDVTVEFDADGNRLVLSAELDQPASEDRLEVYATLLNYSLLWRDTGGVYAAMTAGGTLTLLLPLFGDEVTAELLAAVLENFKAKARILSICIAQPGEQQIAETSTENTMNV